MHCLYFFLTFPCPPSFSCPLVPKPSSSNTPAAWDAFFSGGNCSWSKVPGSGLKSGSEMQKGPDHPDAIRNFFLRFERSLAHFCPFPLAFCSFLSLPNVFTNSFHAFLWSLFKFKVVFCVICQTFFQLWSGSRWRLAWTLIVKEEINF